MKQGLVYLFVFFLSLVISGCSSSARQEDNIISTVSRNNPYVDATPMVARIVPEHSVTSVIEQMDSSDKLHFDAAINDNSTYKASSWVNPNTGVRYTVIPASSMISVKGNADCRRYRVTAMLNEKEQNSYGVACRQEEGGWRVTS